jgi:hypothetical protein
MAVSPTEPPAGLAPDYTAARTAFVEAATAAGANLTHVPHPLTGPDGEALGIDLADIGPRDAAAVAFVVSGTHGAEGFAGSALQTHWLTHHAARRPADVRMVWLHAHNPYGFAWTRRVNEDNVDLNRNYVDWSQPTPSNPDYAGIADLLVPEEWSPEDQERTFNALLEHAMAIGMEAMQAHVSQGQYDHPTGVFYGGTGPTWSHVRMREICQTHLAGASRMGIIDLHTGLGDWGHGELIGHHSVADPGHERAVEWWGDVKSMVDGESVSAALVGDWLVRAEDWLAPAEVTAAALEYGTVDPVAVLQALRADAWLHAHGDPTGADAASTTAEVRAAFADDDPAWIATLWPRFAEVLDAALSRLSR